MLCGIAEEREVEVDLASIDVTRRVAGPTFARRKLTVQALDEITAEIQRYLGVQVLVGALVGVATGLTFLAIGVEHAAVWGVLAFGLNFVPYLGSIVVSAGAALVGFVQFGSLDMALIIAAASVAVHVVSGNLLAPWLTSRASRLNAVTVFVGVLAFGWLWGVWGLVLGVPVLLSMPPDRPSTAPRRRRSRVWLRIESQMRFASASQSRSSTVGSKLTRTALAFDTPAH